MRVDIDMPTHALAEIQEFLNARDLARPRRRGHHLSPDVHHSPNTAFFVTLCARHHRDPFRHSGLAEAVIKAITYRRNAGVWRVFAYCLMPDHLHAVVQLVPPQNGKPASDLLQVMGKFRSFTTRTAWTFGFHGKLWQHDQYDRALRSDRELSIRCHYVLNNPVRKGWVEDWTLWPYSGVMDDDW